ncbi:DNA primase [Chlamydiales bacterium STE3]|nr:DNA primase [Chlamydiales bacterium STE3]
MPIYTKESLETLRKKIDLVEVLEANIELKKAGAAYKALCPFHDEKTPSFMIQRGDTHYHCFGCGAHGDAIHFLMNYQKMNFTQAIEYLAAKFQVILDIASMPQEVKGPSRAKIKEALNLASRLYHFNLLYTDFGKDPLNYLYERGLTLDFLTQFEIGFSPGDPKIFRAFFKDFSEEILLAAGLVTQGNREFFADRILFPIRDGLGAVIGFSARKFKEETFGGKYINTKETVLFKKSKVLFGLNYSRRRIAKERKALIVEGQIDALRLIYAGFDYVVASQGTAFGDEHVQEILHLGPQLVYLALDSDSAGENAAIKIGDLFQKEGIEVRVVELPPQFDPDLFLRKKGSEAFQKLLDGSLDYLTFLVHVQSRSYNLNSPAGKTELVTEIIKQIRRWNNPLMVHESLKKLAALTQTPEEMIGLKEQQGPNLYIKRTGTIGQIEIDPNRILEVDLLRWLLITDNANLKKIAALNLTPQSFHIPQCQKIYEIYQGSANPSLLTLALELDEGEGEAFLNEISSKRINREKAEAQFIETVQCLLERNWMIQRESIKNQIQSGHLDDEKVLGLVKEFDAIKSSPPKVCL